MRYEKPDSTFRWGEFLADAAVGIFKLAVMVAEANNGGGARCMDGSRDMRFSENRGHDTWS